ncbi:MAG: hypothetical protein A3H98_09700 [Bacteroidetes bacterium RIFCSPLOWO2_02_FULL_36_8]|nr:MAG: hypothetical protein A3H98_09700 [Bacteroidetes bacterium RIFCSPLOWO2_02_FULL_36_8]OFY68762.1 MAG: hypothetical protein A3G23_02925 [Bacteroidetes bacterium RIFCSPLOWO2_12_FULL_37_12]
MNLKITEEKNYSELTLDGELDAASSLQVDTVINELLKKKVFTLLINCQKLEYISSAGLGVFISHREHLKNQKGGFVFFGMNEKVKNIFEIVGLDKIMSIKSTRDEGVTLIETIVKQK